LTGKTPGSRPVEDGAGDPQHSPARGRNESLQATRPLHCRMREKKIIPECE